MILYPTPPWREDDAPEPVDLWPPAMEEYGAYTACRGCFWKVSNEDECKLTTHPFFTPRVDCPRKESILKEMDL